MPGYTTEYEDSFGGFTFQANHSDKIVWDRLAKALQGMIDAKFETGLAEKALIQAKYHGLDNAHDYVESAADHLRGFCDCKDLSADLEEVLKEFFSAYDSLVKTRNI